MSAVVNALTVDVEEYYHGMEFEAAVPPEDRHLLPSRVELSVDRVLAVLGGAHVRATFFVVGVVARAHPAMVKQIAAAGHEVACHGDTHELVSRQTPDEFREDVRSAKATLEALVGQRVVGYRAPNYSITHERRWAFDILLEEGFRYDSSVYPIRHDRYGFPDAPRFPYVLRGRGTDTLWEFPLGTVRLLGVNFPIGGGGPFRLFPYELFRRGIRRVNLRERRPVMFYFHPWELDPDQPRPPMPWHHRFRHYVNLHRYQRKLARLVRDVRFDRAATVLGLSEDPLPRLPGAVR
jgi:polysaccharide deacetylase family protein (PEP-CTERM system associated)